MSFPKDILLASYTIRNILGIIVSKRPVSVVLLDHLKLVDAVLDVIERHVRSSFALLRKVHVFVILVVFVDNSLEEGTFGCGAHALDGLGAMSFGEGASANGSSREVGVLIFFFGSRRCELHCSGCFLPILNVGHAL